MIWPILESRAEILAIFRCSFGKFLDTTNLFWNYLTFSNVKTKRKIDSKFIGLLRISLTLTNTGKFNIIIFHFSVVSGSRDATLRMWDINTGECLHVLMGHVAAVRCVQYDGRLVVSGAYDYMVIYLILFWFGKTQPDPN